MPRQARPLLCSAPDRGGSTKRRAGNHRGAGVGHESAARWISPRPALKAAVGMCEPSLRRAKPRARSVGGEHTAHAARWIAGESCGGTPTAVASAKKGNTCDPLVKGCSVGRRLDASVGGEPLCYVTNVPSATSTRRRRRPVPPSSGQFTHRWAAPPSPASQRRLGHGERDHGRPRFRFRHTRAPVPNHAGGPLASSTRQRLCWRCTAVTRSAWPRGKPRRSV